MTSFDRARSSFLIIGAIYSCACSGTTPEDGEGKASLDTHAASATECAPSHEHFIDLGALDPTFAGGYSEALALNERGTVVGYSVVTDACDPGYSSRAFRWKADTGMVDLNERDSTAVDVNERDEVVGNIRSFDGLSRAVIWDAKNGLHELGSFGGQLSEATAINNRGQVVGSGADEYGTISPFVWDAKTGLVAIEVPGPIPARLNDINDSGVVVGAWYKNDDSSVPFKWTKEDGPVELDLLGGDRGEAISINNQGEIAGYVTIDDQNVGVKWTACGASLLPAVVQNASTYPRGINNQGVMVGFNLYESQIAVQWDAMLRVSPLPLDATYSTGRDINNCGNVVGVRTVGYVAHAYLWYPERSAQ